jgi:pyruvate/2-oxoglutarate dehydrogenase complex dihydrolipoamide dehydrogenase (E3) component
MHGPPGLSACWGWERMAHVISQLDFSSLRIAILGGGPGGYEAAMVAASLGADVTVVERAGLGGSAVLTDVVPSKTLIATADTMARVANAHNLGVRFDENSTAAFADLGQVNQRLLGLAAEQSTDIHQGLEGAGARIIIGSGRLLDNHRLEVEADGATTVVEADAILLSTGADPRELPSARPDGERIFTWKQIYNLTEIPEHLIVVGSGVTGAEFASAYNGLGAKVTLVSSRERVLPGEDADAAEVLEDVFQQRGMTVLSQTRADSVERTDDGVRVTLSDGRTVDGSHCLMAVGSIPNTRGIGLEEAGVALTESGHIKVDGVSRTTATNVYAAGDCTGVLPLASVAAMQGRIAMAHLMGDSVSPLKLKQVASNIFTAPEIASVGVSESDVESGRYQGDVIKLSLHTNARAKMMNVQDGFVKIISRKGSGTVIGGVVVAPRASELIYPLALAVTTKLHVDELANTFTVYPSLTGSISEAARRLHVHL